SAAVIRFRVVDECDAGEIGRDAGRRGDIPDGAAIRDIERGRVRAWLGEVPGEGGEESDFDSHLAVGWALRAAEMRAAATIRRSPGRMRSPAARLFQRRTSLTD